VCTVDGSSRFSSSLTKLLLTLLQGQQQGAGMIASGSSCSGR
jgi:hypothetical protein